MVIPYYVNMSIRNSDDDSNHILKKSNIFLYKCQLYKELVFALQRVRLHDLLKNQNMY
uniref:Uncharacterized protein n=1 Tax=Lepeophtheirus salmonis TaxID=72036 RepID=A0A0K2T886_LEPSM